MLPRIDAVAGCAMAAMVFATAHAQPIYHTSPDWESGNPHNSTGAALADIDRDGFLDLIVADGNDILPGRLNVYYNNAGAFPVIADWQSGDPAYNGHLDVADVNGDGWLDVAVAHLGNGATTDHVAKVYLNNNGTLSSIPDWEANVIGNAFGVDFGDVNADGRPDLAVATGWSYGTPHLTRNLVYMNISGTLDSFVSWQSADTFDQQGALFVDADDDGWLDLAMTGTGNETRIYRNTGGTLETNASWTTGDSSAQDGIMLAAGDVTNDGIIDLVATDNTQLGGSGRFKLYTGQSTPGLFSTTYSWNYYEGYGSAVALADVNSDGLLDLATGGWWERTRVFLNNGSGFASTASWTSADSAVNEKIVFGNIDPACGVSKMNTQTFPASGARRLFRLAHQPIQDIVSVKVDGVELGPHEFTFSRPDGWVSIGVTPAVDVVVHYAWSYELDMIVSNWDSTVGNFMYVDLVAHDCNMNNERDGCDIAWGISLDCNTNGTPDECDIWSGDSIDDNGNGVPDECDPAPCPGDTNNDLTVDTDDFLAVLAGWGDCAAPCPPTCAADVAGDDCTVNTDDFLAVLAGWGPCIAP